MAVTDSKLTTVDLVQIKQLTEHLGAGGRSLDLSNLIHGRATHAHLVPASVLSWWLLGTDLPLEGVELRVPGPGSAPLRHLARAGVITAAQSRGLRIAMPDGREFEWRFIHSDPNLRVPQLSGVDWDTFDDPQSDNLRVLRDLSDPGRVVPGRKDRRYAHPWLANMGLASAALSPEGYRRLLQNADTVLVELMDNVLRWSRAARAFASVSVTRGGGVANGQPMSWNRLHLVIADNGIGIPAALRGDLVALMAMKSAVGCDELPSDWTDGVLVERLLRHAFGARKIPNHNGQGLNAAQIRAGQWIGTLDVVTIGTNGQAFRVASRGLAPSEFEVEDCEGSLPGARGTLIHLMLQGVDSSIARAEAAQAEKLEFDIDSFERQSSDAFALVD